MVHVSDIGSGGLEPALILPEVQDETHTSIVDGSDFRKQGRMSVGVARQWCGELSKRAHCQAVVFVAYAGEQGACLVHRALYLPRPWAEDPDWAERRHRCRVPAAVPFRTKPQWAAALLEEVVTSGHLPARWVTCDEAYSQDPTFLGLRLPGPEVWLLLRRHPRRHELKTYLCHAPADMPLASLAHLASRRWPIESYFQEGKQNMGLGDYEGRSWQGWHRHMTLCLLAHFFLVRQATRLKKTPRPDRAPGGGRAPHPGPPPVPTAAAVPSRLDFSLQY